MAGAAAARLRAGKARLGPASLLERTAAVSKTDAPLARHCCTVAVQGSRCMAQLLAPGPPGLTCWPAATHGRGSARPVQPNASLPRHGLHSVGRGGRPQPPAPSDGAGAAPQLPPPPLLTRAHSGVAARRRALPPSLHPPGHDRPALPRPACCSSTNAFDGSECAGQHISLWMDQMGDTLQPRPALPGDVEADVAIVGAGYTGLWTAYYLKQAAPELSVVVLEAEVAGFGASGRNAGWLSGEVQGQDRLLAGLPPEQRAASHALLHGIPDEVGRVLEREGIDCDFRKAGVLYCAARFPEQGAWLREQLAHWRAQGHDEDSYRWLDVPQLNQQLRLASPYGAVFSPHVATVHPAKLVRGLARCVERLGVRVFERTRVAALRPGRLDTAQGAVRARWLVPAVEGYAATLPPLGRWQLPVQSLIIATEPLPPAVWRRIGLRRGQAFSESSRQVSYGQRTPDDRMVFGARSGYLFGGRLRRDFRLSAAEVGARRELLAELFPVLAGARISHAWGGNLGMARSFHPHVLCDAGAGVALAGGYGGEGVGASNLAGRSLADLILGRDSLLTRQPWVHRGPLGSLRRWELEPLRWLGYTAIVQSFAWEDQVLKQADSPAWKRRLAQRLAGCMEGLMR